MYTYVCDVNRWGRTLFKRAGGGIVVNCSYKFFVTENKVYSLFYNINTIC